MVAGKMMTRDEILNMPAGREMDALVAEKVMGWIPKDNLYWKDNEGSFAGWATEFSEYSVKPFRPSTDIVAAWQVLEHLIATGEQRFEAPALFKYPLAWLCVFYQKHEKPGEMAPAWIDANAPTAPLAICRAALLAVMESEE